MPQAARLKRCHIPLEELRVLQRGERVGA
jgi:hypothetical protein